MSPLQLPEWGGGLQKALEQPRRSSVMCFLRGCMTPAPGCPRGGSQTRQGADVPAFLAAGNVEICPAG